VFLIRHKNPLDVFQCNPDSINLYTSSSLYFSAKCGDWDTRVVGWYGLLKALHEIS
jgi:hypothetical protein